MIRRALGAHGLAILDQGLSSGTNFLVVFVLAGSLNSSEFGIFAMAYTVLTLFVGVTRSYFGLPLALAAHRSESELTALYRTSMTALCWIAIPVAATVFGVGALSSLGADEGAVETGLLAAGAVALATPMVMMQDISRYYSMARDEPTAAVVSDSIWLVGIVALFIVRDLFDPAVVLLAWTAVILASLVYFVVKFAPKLAPRAGLRILVPKQGLRESISVTVILSTGVTLVMGFLMLPFLGASAVGSIRGAGTLFGPVNTMMALLDFSVLGQLARRERSRDAKSILVIAGVVCGVSALWSVALLVLPENLGQLILGDTWAGARSILPITAVEYVFLCFAACVALIPKLRDQAKVLLFNRVWASVAILGASIVALLLGGGVVWMALALLFGAVVSALGLMLSVRRDLRNP